MNQQKKRKLSDVSCHVAEPKKTKVDSESRKKFKNRKNEKKRHELSSTNIEKDMSKHGPIKNSQNSLKEKSSIKCSKRQWQSVKEKRKRLKKKYTVTGGINNNSKSAIVKDKHSNREKSNSDIVKLPQSSIQYSENWKNLMKTLNIPQPKKKRKKNKEEGKHSQVLLKDEQKKEPEIWFDDVDDILLERKPTGKNADKLVKQESYTGLTKDIAMDCEMVGVGWNAKDNQLARVSLVNHYGHCVFDKFVKPKEKVTDYRTHVSGIRPEDLQNGEEFENVQKEVAAILQDRLLIGHAIHNDLQVIYISHPKNMIRDTSKYKPFRQLFDGRNPSLKKLTDKVLGVTVQEGEHNSIQDAQAAMRLYTMYKKQWEKDVKNKHRHIKKGPKKKKKVKL